MNISNKHPSSIIEHGQKTSREKPSSTSSKWQILPCELWISSFEFLPIRDRILCMSVSRQFLEIATDEHFWAKIVRDKFSEDIIYYNLTSYYSISELIIRETGDSKERYMKQIYLARLGLSTIERAYKEAFEDFLKFSSAYQWLKIPITTIISEQLKNNEPEKARALIASIELIQPEGQKFISQFNEVIKSYVNFYSSKGQLKIALSKTKNAILLNKDWYEIYSLIWINLDNPKCNEQESKELHLPVERRIKNGIQLGYPLDSQVCIPPSECLEILAKNCTTSSQIARMQNLARTFTSPEKCDCDEIEFNFLIKDLDSALEMTLKLPDLERKKSMLERIIFAFKKEGNVEQAALATKCLDDIQ